MKIAILTLPLHENYGGNIQNYALQCVLSRLGHEAITINCKGKDFSSFRFFLSTAKRLLLQPKDSRQFMFSRSEKNQISINHRRFIREHINITEPLDFSSLKKFFDENNFDAVFVGSDQVWRPKYASSIESYFLDFLEENSRIKKISYAASFGTDEWEYTHQQQHICKLLAKKFDALSVRESIGVDMCAKYLDVIAQHVLDPTMLLDKYDYMDLLKGKTLNDNTGDIFNYTLDMDSDKKELIDEIAIKLRKKIFYTYPINTKKTTAFIRDIDAYRYPSVEAWLKSFYDADFIVTDSFHGTVFSILFNKPFISISNKNRGAARFTSLLQVFGLEDRLITDSKQVDERMLYGQIDYEKVNKRLEELRHLSTSFIVKALQH